MMAGSVEVHLPGFDERQMIRNGESLALPDIFAMQYTSVLIADQNPGMRNLSIRAAARDKRAQQNCESAERRDDCFHSSSAKMPILRAVPGLRGRTVKRDSARREYHRGS